MNFAPVIFVVGKPQHGKTTIRDIVSQKTGLRGGSCSDVVYHYLAARRQVSVEALRQEPKEALRPTLIQAGDFMCGIREQPPEEAPVNPEPDAEIWRHPSALIRCLYLNGVNVIDGVRRRLELLHAREALEWVGVRSAVIFVDRPGGPQIADNTEDLREFATVTISNDGTINDLETKVLEALTALFPPPAAASAEKASETKPAE